MYVNSLFQTFDDIVVSQKTWVVFWYLYNQRAEVFLISASAQKAYMSKLLVFMVRLYFKYTQQNFKKFTDQQDNK